MLTSDKVTELVHYRVEIDVLDLKCKLYDARSRVELAELIRDVIAIANSAYQCSEVAGYLVFGLDDKTHEPTDISGQKLDFKAKKTTSLTQQEIDAQNQRDFVKIATEYIEGVCGRLRVKYTTWAHPDVPTALVGILEISALYGPYVVKKEIPELSAEGKTVGRLVEPDQAWIREGEDKRQLKLSEIAAMQKDSERRQREMKRRDKERAEFGALLARWETRLLDIPVGNPVERSLVPGPLQTEAQLSACYRPSPALATFLSSLGEKWYLSNLVIASPPGTGRTSLLWYLVHLRAQAQAKGAPLLIDRFSPAADVAEFVEYVRAIRHLDLSERSYRLLIFDKPDAPDEMLLFIKNLASAFPNLHFWISCNPAREEALLEGIAADSLDHHWIVLHLPGYLDADELFYEDLVESIWHKRDDINYLLSQVNMTFQTLVACYEVTRQGIKLQGIIPSRLDQLTAKYAQLSTAEQMLVKLVHRLRGIPALAAQLICTVSDFSVNSYVRIVESELVYTEPSSWLTELRPAADLPEHVRAFGALEERTLITLLSEMNTSLSPLAGWYLQEIASRLKDMALSAEHQYQFETLTHKGNGDYFCEVCSAHFDSRLRHCPNCGGGVERRAGGVVPNTRSQTQQVPVPFPNADLLKMGTFTTERGVPSDAMRQIRADLRAWRNRA